MDQGAVNLRWCQSLLGGLVSAGLQRVVISPGSRSTPLVLAAMLDAALETEVILDERSAAFFALGQARASGRPVALICTSGTAAANWLPAVVEASHSGVPLILLSADRPWELQQCGANQTIDQIKLFGDQVRAFHALSEPRAGQPPLRLHQLGRQVMAQSQWPDPGPVHINLPFREPLVPRSPPASSEAVPVEPFAAPRLLPVPEQCSPVADLLQRGKGVIVCGPGETPGEVVTLADALGAPVLADPLSGLRFGRNGECVVTHYDLFLRQPPLQRSLQPDWVLRIGGLPVSTTLQGWLGSLDVTQILVDSRGRWSDPLSRVTGAVRADPALLCEQLLQGHLGLKHEAWLQRWRLLEQRTRQLLGESKSALPAESRIIRQLAAALPDESLLFLGNSLPIRFFDAWSGSGRQPVAVYGNRGASGIDGNVSTFLGLASARQGEGKAVAVMGDLTFQHDLGGLANHAGIDGLILVFNNGGGGIFDTLPQQGLSEYERYWRTPQAIDLSAVARLFGVEHLRLDSVDVAAVLAADVLDREGLSVVEVMLDAEQSRKTQEKVLGELQQRLRKV